MSLIVFGVRGGDFDLGVGDLDLGGGDSLTLTFLAGGESLPVEVEGFADSVKKKLHQAGFQVSFIIIYQQ